MKIPLNDPIWNQLDGPCGVEGVGEILASLNHRWDEELAGDLFWEKLHHQDDIYSVTYAALPWIWDLLSKHPEAKDDILAFVSHAICCSVAQPDTDCSGQRTEHRFRGLSEQIGGNAPGWLPEEVLKFRELETWFARTVPEMLLALHTAMEPSSIAMAGRMAAAIFAWEDESGLSGLASLWADGMDVEEILRIRREDQKTPEVLSLRERSTALSFAKSVETASPAFASFLRLLADEADKMLEGTPTSDDDRQFSFLD